MKLALRGAAWRRRGRSARARPLGLGLESWRFTPGAIIAFRVILGAALVGLVGYLLVRPLMRSVTDEQVALYLEEHEPSLQAAIISAVEAGRGGADCTVLPRLVSKLVESAVEQVRAIESGRRVERAPRAPLRADARRARRRRARALRARSRVPAPRAVRAASCCHASVEGGRAVPHRGHAGQRDRAARRGSDHHREAVRLRRRAGVADGAQDPGSGRSSACRSSAATTASTKACCSISPRRSVISSRPTASAPRSSR